MTGLPAENRLRFRHGRGIFWEEYGEIKSGGTQILISTTTKILQSNLCISTKDGIENFARLTFCEAMLLVRCLINVGMLPARRA